MHRRWARAVRRGREARQGGHSGPTAWALRRWPAWALAREEGACLRDETSKAVSRESTGGEVWQRKNAPSDEPGLEPAGDPPFELGVALSPCCSACALFCAKIACRPPALPIPGMTDTGAALPSPERAPRPTLPDLAAGATGTFGAAGIAGAVGAAGAFGAAGAAGAAGGARRTGAGGAAAGLGLGGTSWRYCGSTRVNQRDA